MFGRYCTCAGKCFPCMMLTIKPYQLETYFMTKLQKIQYKSSFWYIVDPVFESDFLKTNCLNLDLLGLQYTLMLSLNLPASNNLAKEISSHFDGWNIVNSDLGVSLEIIPMIWIVLAPVMMSLLWSKLSAMNCQNLFSHSNSLSQSYQILLWIQQQIPQTYLRVWEWEPNQVRDIQQKIWSQDFVQQSSRALFCWCVSSWFRVDHI